MDGEEHVKEHVSVVSLFWDGGGEEGGDDDGSCGCNDDEDDADAAAAAAADDDDEGKDDDSFEKQPNTCFGPSVAKRERENFLRSLGCLPCCV